MSTDLTTRLLLLGILLCLIALVAQGFGDGPLQPTFGRYQVTGTRAGSPILIRTDTETGKVWKLELRGGDDTWTLFAEGEGSGEGAPATGGLADNEPAAASPEPASEPSAPYDEITDPEPAAPKIKFAPKRPAPPPVAREPVETSPEEEVALYANAATREDLMPEMRIWAVKQLANLEVPQSTQVLIQAAATPDPQVALAAVEALSGREGEGVDAALERAQSHPDPSVQEAAREALGQ